MQLWREVRVQLQEEAGAAWAGSANVRRLMQEAEGEGGEVIAVGQLQPRFVLVQLMSHVLQLAHAAAAAGARRRPPAAAASAVTQTPGVAFSDIIVPLTQDGVRSSCCVACDV